MKNYFRKRILKIAAEKTIFQIWLLCKKLLSKFLIENHYKNNY